MNNNSYTADPTATGAHEHDMAISCTCSSLQTGMKMKASHKNKTTDQLNRQTTRTKHDHFADDNLTTDISVERKLVNVKMLFDKCCLVFLLFDKLFAT